MNHSWYDTAYRKLFFDFHSAGTVEGLAAAFDADDWAERVQQAHAQAVSVFTKGGFGYSFYQKGSIRYQHPHLPAGLDMLEAQISALHQRGLHAIGYYHTFNSEPIARDHPDWIEREADGTPRGISICLLSPLTTEWMLPHIEEIVTLYDVDAMFFDGTFVHGPCYCEACRERYSAASGGLDIPIDKTDPAWPRYVAWKLQALREVREAITDTIHRHRPEVVVSFNWAYAPRMPELVPESVGALMADIPPEDQVFNGSYLAAYWALMGKPFDVMNSAFLQWWGDWGCKPALAMQQEVATIIAHGGLTWVGYQMTQDFNVAPAVLEEMGKTLDFVRHREPLLEGARPVPHVAVLHSTSQYLAARQATFMVRESSARGAHRMLTESMIPYHLVNEQVLLQRLPQLRAVILPGQRYLSDDLVAALGDWVRGGGVLIATAFTGTTDEAGQETGRFALEDILGLRLEGAYDQTHAYLEVMDARLLSGTLEMPHLVEAETALARPFAKDVQTLARLRGIYLRSGGQFLLRWSPVGADTGYPGITLRPVGEGYAVYLAAEVCHAYQVKNQWNLKHIIANLLYLTIPDPPVTVEAPAWLEVVLMRQPPEYTPDGRERLLVHLVNQHGDRPVDGLYHCTEQVLPVTKVKVRVRCPKRPAAITLEPAGVTPEWEYRQGVAIVAVPEVTIHRVVAVQM